MSGKDKFAESSGERRRISMIAVAWFVRLRSAEKTPDDERRFGAWLAEDEAHRAVFESISNAWEEVGALDTLQGFQAIRQEALRQRPRGLVHYLRSGIGGARLPRPGRVGWGIAASVAAVLVLTVMGMGTDVFQPGTGVKQSYRTAAGERSTITLADGSRVTLTSDSRVMAKFSDNARVIVLSRGEAFFDVAHDPERPFRVEAGSGTVTALGTEFDVYKKNGEVVVTLIDGRVEVAARNRVRSDNGAVRRLRAGERISYDESGLLEVREVDIAQAAAWRQGRIIVTDEPLLHVIDEMNRHSRRKLKVNRADPRLQNLLVTGQFRTGRPELLVQYIRAAGIQVWATHDGEGNVSLRLRGDSSRG